MRPSGLQSALKSASIPDRASVFRMFHPGIHRRDFPTHFQLMNCIGSIIFRFFILLLMTSGLSHAAKPKAPSDFKVVALGANSFALSWKDNSDDENGWEILVNVGAGSIPLSYQFINEANRTGHLVIANELPGKLVRFQVRAYRGSGTDQIFSEKTPIVEVTALSPVVFEPAEKLRATALDDANVRLRWVDRSTTEYGYFIQIRKGTGDWEFLGSAGLARRYNITAQSLEPNTQYTFRVVAFKGQGQVVSAPSNEAKVKTPDFVPPGKLAAKAEGEGLISLSWKDRSALEEGYEIQSRIVGKKFRSLGTVPANETKTRPISFDMNQRYEFRIRGFRTVKKKKVYSRFSEVVSRRSTGLAKPTDLAVASTTEESIKLTWKDVSSRETGYTLRYKEVGSSLAAKVVELPAGSTTHTVEDLPVGKNYEFQVRAVSGQVVSRYTPLVTGFTRDQFTGSFDLALTSGVSFDYEVEVTTPANVVETTVTDLPAGLTLNPTTRTISGVVSEAGVYEALVRVKFAAGYTIEKTLVLRVVAQEGGPVVVSEIGTVQVNRGSSKDVPLTGRFRDSDVSVARRFTTNIGTFDVVLFEEATPLTVQNFLAYADGGRFRNTFFHRAPQDFVVQGGGFTHNGSSFGEVNTFPPVQNEPGISNRRGTVAMAKLGGDPNSATSQFFINLSDNNASNLDFQNGGFTVFGRIAGDGMDLFDDVNDMPKGDYVIDPGSGNINLDDVPVDTEPPAPSALDPSKLVKVSSVSASPIIRFSVTSLDPAVATATLVGGNLRVTGVSAGTARVRVRATDLDGLFADQLVSVTVP